MYLIVCCNYVRHQVTEWAMVHIMYCSDFQPHLVIINEISSRCGVHKFHFLVSQFYFWCDKTNKMVIFQFETSWPLNPTWPPIAILKNIKYDNFGSKQVMEMHNIPNYTILGMTNSME